MRLIPPSISAAALQNTGSQAWNAANNNGIDISGNLTQTGASLEASINSLSGYSNNSFSTISNLQLTGQQNYIFISGVSGNLIQTGILIETQINSLSGWAASNVNLTGLSGQFNINLALTGQQAWSAANNNGINISGNLTTSGSNLYSNITGLSGYLNPINILVTGLNFNFNLSNSIEYFYTWTGSVNSTGILPSLTTASGFSYTIKNKATGFQLLISGNVDNIQNFIVYPLDSYTFKSDSETWNVI